MNVNVMKKVPAYRVLRALSLLLLLLALTLLLWAWSGLTGPPLGGAHRVIQLSLGVLLLLAGMAGPLRIIHKGAYIPAEIRRLIAIQALVLPLWGLAFILAGARGTGTALALGYGIGGLLLLFSAFAGFYRLSTRLPPTFYIDEMVNVIRTVGLAGERSQSPADREFRRWTDGRRAGVVAGERAPDGGVLTLEGTTEKLSSYFGSGPEALLVLNFGSYSCPHHRKRFDELRELKTTWQQHGVTFLTVYTVEAHPEDGWKLPHQYDADKEFTSDDEFCFYYARSAEDRLAMVRWLVEKTHFDWRVVADAADDTLMRAYNSWPIRLYVLRGAEVVFCGEQGPFGYDPQEVDRFLRRQKGI